MRKTPNWTFFVMRWVVKGKGIILTEKRQRLKRYLPPQDVVNSAYVRSLDSYGNADSWILYYIQLWMLNSILYTIMNIMQQVKCQLKIAVTTAETFEGATFCFGRCPGGRWFIFTPSKMICTAKSRIHARGRTDFWGGGTFCHWQRWPGDQWFISTPSFR